jgi:hypothetical protein
LHLFGLRSSRSLLLNRRAPATNVSQQRKKL